MKGGIEAVGSRTAGRVAGLVLAAGAARRFGSPKQLALLGGRPLLEHALATITAAGLDRVVVVLGCHADQVLAGVDLQGAETVRSERWSEGQAASTAFGSRRPWKASRARRRARASAPSPDPAEGSVDSSPA